MIDLYIEPGKSLLSNLGMTISKVSSFVKKSSKGEVLSRPFNEKDGCCF
jgi:diaminopimelate decarboxylase